MSIEPGTGTSMPNPPEPDPAPAPEPEAAPDGAAASPPTPPSTSPPPSTLPPASTLPPPSPAGTGTESTADMLRLMLSRAAEDQIEEQREMVGAMGDVRTQLMRLGQQIAEMRAHESHDASADAQVNHVTVEMREAVRFLSERLDGVTRVVAQRGEELADIRGALNGIDAHLRSQAETIGVLTAGLQSLPSFGERVSNLHDNLQVVRQQLLGIEETLAATDDGQVDARLASIETSVTPLADRLEAFTQTSLTESAASMSDLQRTLAGLEQTVAALQDRIEPIASDVTAIGGNVAGLVEGTADGAALDSRVRESVSHAVGETERRVIGHIDEAVLALAQTLLRRRPATVPAVVTEDRPGETPIEAPSFDSPPPASSEFDAEPESDAEPEAEAVAESFDVTNDIVVETGAEFDAGVIPVLEAEINGGLDGGGPTDELADSRELADILEAAPAADAAGRADSREPDAIDHVNGEADGSADPNEAVGTDRETEPAGDQPTVTWSPQTPPQRAPAEESAEAGSEPKRKRRWFR